MVCDGINQSVPAACPVPEFPHVYSWQPQMDGPVVADNPLRSKAFEFILREEDAASLRSLQDEARFDFETIR